MSIKTMKPDPELVWNSIQALAASGELDAQIKVNAELKRITQRLIEVNALASDENGKLRVRSGAHTTLTAAQRRAFYEAASMSPFV